MHPLSSRRPFATGAGFRARGARLAAALLVAAAPAAAQDAPPLDVRGEVFVGSEIERYLRVVQVAGGAPLYPWSLRGFSPREVDRVLPADSLHPWARRYRLAADPGGGARVRVVRPRAQAIFNSATPYGDNDGPVWAGRGLTASLEGGLAAEWGPLSLTLAPVALMAQNAEFALLDNGQEGERAYADSRYPNTIDLPQRFGSGAYVRVDPGQSTLRLDARGVAAGISTASQQWGPASDNPLLMGNNAGGFPHVFLGTARPVNVWLGRVHGRMVWGAPRHTGWAPDSAGRRFFVGAVATFVPRGVPGLEIGGGRLFHLDRPEGGIGLDELLTPFEGVFKGSLGPGGGSGNQLASAFFRWVHRRDAVELWGEFAREDHSAGLRDFVLEPDHASAFLLGGRKVWRRADGRLSSLRAELVDGRLTHLARVRPQSPFYVHSEVRQGHTHAGQLLGSPLAYGGAGSLVAFDAYGRGGRWSVLWNRSLRDALGAQSAAAGTPRGTAVTHALGVERLFFMGRFDATARLTGAYQLNRNFTEDGFNLNLVLSVSSGL